ncbi:MAG: hypothetical protein BMS9Abin14_705 [Gammaproteobacteria bacterium]|nr:MAG: hypothetical protein BMS9Abin14_705 [Gammaproteobacteria bacterium]
MSKIESLYGATPAEIFQSGLENLDDIQAIAVGVLWKDGSITTGWSNMDVGSLARLILLLDEAQRRRTVGEDDA